MSEINVSYEHLFEIMRSEKHNNDFQKLPDDFYQMVVDYIKEKQDLLKKDDDLFGINEKKQVMKLLENLDKIMTEIYNQREKKIIDLALLKSKARSSLINTQNMLRSEQLFYEKVLLTFDNFRSNILFNTLSARDFDINVVDDKKKADNDIVTVRLLDDIDKFVDQDLKEYGPYEKETIATLPLILAKNLEEQGKLEILEDV